MLALAALLIFFSSAVSLPSQPCPEGSFVNNGTCTPCPLGTFSFQFNSPSCTSCPIGYKGVQTGGKFFYLACIECPPGTFAPVAGSTSCTPCPSGLGSGYRYAKCISCRPGFFISLVPPSDETFSCSSCEENTFSKGGVVFECEQCPEGSFNNNRGSSTCVTCPPGSFAQFVDRFFRQFFRCNSCPPGTFSEAQGLSRCKDCPPGTSSVEGASTCKPCPHGKFAPDFGTPSCLNCPSDTSSLGLRPVACKHVSRGCPFDTFESNEGERERCIPGERYDEKTNRCQQCGENQTSLGGVSSVCRFCQEEEVLVQNLETGLLNMCACKQGLAQTPLGCVPCSNSRFGPFCLNCDSFMGEVPNADFTKCVFCPEGSYIKGGLCVPCPPGFRGQTITAQSRFVNRQCISESTGCPLGLTLRGTGCRFETCPPDERFSSSGGCFSCDPGEFLSLRRNNCFSCPTRLTSQGGLVTSCSRCPKGRVGNRGKCVCADGTEEKNGECVNCPPGTESSEGEKCRRCRPGTFTNVPGAAFCIWCPENQVTTVESGATSCVPCPAGSKVEQLPNGILGNRCIPKDPYNNDRSFVASLPGFQVA